MPKPKFKVGQRVRFSDRHGTPPDFKVGQVVTIKEVYDRNLYTFAEDEVSSRWNEFWFDPIIEPRVGDRVKVVLGGAVKKDNYCVGKIGTVIERSDQPDHPFPNLVRLDGEVPFKTGNWSDEPLMVIDRPKVLKKAALKAALDEANERKDMLHAALDAMTKRRVFLDNEVFKLTDKVRRMEHAIANRGRRIATRERWIESAKVESANLRAELAEMEKDRDQLGAVLVYLAEFTDPEILTRALGYWDGLDEQ